MMSLIKDQMATTKFIVHHVAMSPMIEEGTLDNMSVDLTTRNRQNNYDKKNKGDGRETTKLVVIARMANLTSVITVSNQGLESPIVHYGADTKTT